MLPSAAPGPLEGDGHGARHAARGPRHGGGARMIRPAGGGRMNGVGPTLLVIAKSPAPGRVKTRLTPPCTPEQAARLAGAALSDTLAAAARTRRAARRVLVLDGASGPWVPRGFEVVPQRGDGLAARLAAAFQAAGGPAFLVGMDTPQVTPELLDAGLAALEHADAAFGAALDGGYWGIGLRRAGSRGVPRRADERADHRRLPARPPRRARPRAPRSCRRCATSTRSPTPTPSPPRHPHTRFAALAPRGASGMTHQTPRGV